MAKAITKDITILNMPIIDKEIFVFKIFVFSILQKTNKKGQVIFKNNLTYKTPLVGSRSNRFWKDLKKFRE